MAARFEWRTSLCAADFPETAYEALRLRVTDHTPFNTLAWMRASEQALPTGQRLHVLLGWQGHELVLCLPLVDWLSFPALLPPGVHRQPVKRGEPKTLQRVRSGYGVKEPGQVTAYL